MLNWFGCSHDLKKVTSEKKACEALIDAISRSSAVISFDINGQILEANDNFLAAVGYQLDEVVGKHHRIFVLPEEQQSAAYQAFWQKLASGEFFRDRFARRHKSGSLVWLEASYNPVFNEAGQVVKVIKVATDITQQVNLNIVNEAKLSAIDRSMASIEFDTQGMVLTANANFLKVMGYSLSELVGQHHQRFVQPSYAQSAAYQDFWQRLGEGELMSGTFERIDAQGRTVWLEANYNPVFDSQGKVVKVIKYGVDVTEEEIRKRSLSRAVSDASEVLLALADGDLTKQMPSGVYKGELHDLKNAMNYTIESFKRIVTETRSSAEAVRGSAEQVSMGASDLSARVQQQAAALEETSATMHEMSSAVASNADNVTKVTELAKLAESQTQDGGHILQQMIEAMNAIHESSHKISDIVNLIDGIAFQTNLLALNAAVEAARAGEHGRGFAVVASEVRALAQKSAEAAKDIKNLIDDSAKRVENGQQLAHLSDKTLSGVTEVIHKVGSMIEEIAVASREQSVGIGQVHQAISQIDAVTQQNAALVEETTASAENLRDEANSLQANMSLFKL